MDIDSGNNAIQLLPGYHCRDLLLHEGETCCSVGHRDPLPTVDPASPMRHQRGWFPKVEPFEARLLDQRDHRTGISGCPESSDLFPHFGTTTRFAQSTSVPGNPVPFE
jgi:hypothetical protein